MTFLRRTLTVASAAALMAAPLSAQTFFGLDSAPPGMGPNANAARTSFLSNLVGVGTENFESLSGSSPTLTFPGAGSASLLGTGSVLSSPGAGRFATSGSRFYETRSTNSGSTFSVRFGSAVAAFGFFGTDIGDFGSQLSLQFWRAGSVIDTWALPYAGPGAGGYSSLLDGSLMYAGYINTNEFDRVDFIGTDASDVFGFDDMTVGSLQQVNTVPEPSTYVLMASGLGMVGFFARRRRA